MKNKKILSVITAALFALALTGCYEKQTEPPVQSRYSDDWFTGKGYTIESIETVKKLFEDPSHDLINHLENTGSATYSIAGTSPTNTASYGRYYYITESYVIKGKVITDDAYGNFYRSIFIQDEEGNGIEVKVGPSGLYTKYPIGQTVYVICHELYLGNYRSSLSLGVKPEVEDQSDSGEPYANKYMDVQTIIDKHVFLGEKTSLTADDIKVINAGASISDADFTALGGRLVRLEGLVSSWTSGEEGYPNFLHKLGTNSYKVYSFQYAMDQWTAYQAEVAAGGTPEKPPMPEPQNNYIEFDDPDNPGQKVHLPTWGFQEHEGSVHNFGSALFTWPAYTGAAEINIRTSGYARFALRPVTPNGKTVNITGIVSRYTSKSGGNVTYQITVNNIGDIVQTD